MSPDIRSWYTRWFKRSLKAYVRGRISGREAISLDNILGKARGVLREGYLFKEGLLAIIDSIVENPASPPEISGDAKGRALWPFIGAFMKKL